MKAVIIPFFIKFEDWASQLSFLRNDLLWPTPTTSQEWLEWASAVYMMNIESFPHIPIPSRHFYKEKESWREWGSQFTFLIS